MYITTSEQDSSALLWENAALELAYNITHRNIVFFFLAACCEEKTSRTIQRMGCACFDKGTTRQRTLNPVIGSKWVDRATIYVGLPRSIWMFSASC